MIDRQLRPIGEAIRFVWPSFSERKFKFCNFILKNFGRGADVTPWKIKCEQIKIPRADGSELRLCVYSPRKREGEMPGLLWIHGGGYAMGIPEQDHGFVRSFVGATGCVMVVPDYKKSLYAPFPAALEDCYLALLWLKENGKKYGMRRDKIFVGGNSAGGGMTAALTLYARDKGEVNIAFQMPLYPISTTARPRLQKTTTRRSGTQNRTSPRGSCISATTTARTGSRNTPHPRARPIFPVCRRHSLLSAA